MEIFLSASARDRRGNRVLCHFKATANSFDLQAEGGSGGPQPLYKLPPDTHEVEVTATPDDLDTYWPRTLTFSVSNNVITVDPLSKGFVQMETRPEPGSGTFDPPHLVTQATFNMSQFQDATEKVLKLLGDPPDERSVFDERTNKYPLVKAHEIEKHNWTYGMSPPDGWPPKDWDLDGIPHVDFLDVANPLTSGALNFAPAPSSLGTVLNVDSFVLERAGKSKVPKYFAVTWPDAIAPDPDAIRPTPFLLFIRQYNRYNYAKAGLFVGDITLLRNPGVLTQLQSYPDNFDYADTGMFESLHYAGPTPTTPPPAVKARSPLWSPNSKGVPYQAARAGVKVVCVFPCNKFAMNDKDPEYGVMNDPEETERILLEIQAFMFWKRSVNSAPQTIDNTAVATFSAGNFFLNKWLQDATKRNGHFMSDVVKAIYLLEPIASYPNPKTGETVQFLDGLIDSALKWADQNADKRIRLYLQYEWPSLRRLIDDQPSLHLGASPLPPPPFFAKPSNNNRRTVSVTPNATWTKTVGRAPSQPLEWVHVHHLICATMLTHALKQDL